MPCLEALHDITDIAVVISQPDRPAGRGLAMRPPAVKKRALELGLEVWQPRKVRTAEFAEKLRALDADVAVVVAYGRILPRGVLDSPRTGCVNVHASLLPRWRGAAPIQRAIEAGDEQTGVCIMQMEATLDTGPVYQCHVTPVGPMETAGILHNRLAAMGARALTQCIEMAIRDELPLPAVQDDTQAVYAHKLSKAEAELDWNLTAEELQRKVRAFNPWPVAWCELGGQRLRIWQAEVVDNVSDCQPGQLFVDRQSFIVGTAEKSLKILELQRAGGQRMKTGQFLNAHKPQSW